MEIHKDESLADWELCQNGEKPFKIELLKFSLELLSVYGLHRINEEPVLPASGQSIVFS